MNLEELKNHPKCYFSTQRGTLLLGDCLDIMQEFPDNSFDLCLTDPQYGINEMTYRKNKSRSKLALAKDYGDYIWDQKIPNREYFIQISRISINQIIFGGNYFTKYLKASSCWLVWDKDNTGNFADCELAWTSFNTAVRIFRYRWNGMLQENMKNKEEREHPNQKPAGLFIQILNKYSDKNNYILDCYAGSGTTGVACERLNRQYVLIEKELKYCEIIKQRLIDETRQKKLF